MHDNLDKLADYLEKTAEDVRAVSFVLKRISNIPNEIKAFLDPVVDNPVPAQPPTPEKPVVKDWKKPTKKQLCKQALQEYLDGLDEPFDIDEAIWTIKESDPNLDDVALDAVVRDYAESVEPEAPTSSFEQED